MYAFVINSQKGGSGKSLLAKHLAVEAHRAGDGPVFMIDTDPQGTLKTWHERRPEESQPFLVDLPFHAMQRGLDLLRRQGAGVVIIDTAAGRLDEPLL